MLRILIHILFLRPLLKLFSGVTVIGKENLVQLDRYIIIANHNSHLDIFVLFGLIPIRDICRTHTVAAQEYFSKYHIVFRIVRFLFNTIFIARRRYARTEDPLEELRSAIEHNQNVIVFPEGTRGRPGEIQHFKSGIGRLVSQYPEIPIVPVFLSGPERALPRSSRLLVPFWNYVVIGPPQLCRGTHRDITRQLEQTLIKLSRSESARRHKRYSEKKKLSQSIALLGIDGSGKSTISRMIAKELSDSSTVSLVSDDLELYEHGALKDMQPFITEKVRHTISLYAKKAQSLKLYKIPKMAELMLRNHLHHELARWYVSDYVVLDGSPLLNMVAWAVLYKKESFNEETCCKAISILTGNNARIPRNDHIYKHFPELSYLRYLRLNTLKLPDMVAFIDVSPATACTRIDTRGEMKQVHETADKLTELRQAYHRVCDILQQQCHVPVITIDGEDTLESIASKAGEFIGASTLKE
ncbi:1-acyl-sn-glycerol-3-phosphate acyltransferase [Candidatus Latescibacterota bacterium]